MFSSSSPPEGIGLQGSGYPSAHTLSTDIYEARPRCFEIPDSSPESLLSAVGGPHPSPTLPPADVGSGPSSPNTVRHPPTSPANDDPAILETLSNTNARRTLPSVDGQRPSAIPPNGDVSPDLSSPCILRKRLRVCYEQESSPTTASSPTQSPVRRRRKRRHTDRKPSGRSNERAQREEDMLEFVHVEAEDGFGSDENGAAAGEFPSGLDSGESCGESGASQQPDESGSDLSNFINDDPEPSSVGRPSITPSSSVGHELDLKAFVPFLIDILERSRVASDRITLRGTEAEKQLQALRRLLRRRPAKITYRELRDGWRRFQDALPPQRYVLPSYGNPHRDTSNLGTAIDELDFETCERQFMGQQSSASRQDNSSSSQGSVHPPFSQGQASSV